MEKHSLFHAAIILLYKLHAFSLFLYAHGEYAKADKNGCAPSSSERHSSSVIRPVASYSIQMRERVVSNENCIVPKLYSTVLVFLPKIV